MHLPCECVCASHAASKPDYLIDAKPISSEPHLEKRAHRTSRRQRHQYHPPTRHRLNTVKMVSDTASGLDTSKQKQQRMWHWQADRCGPKGSRGGHTKMAPVRHRIALEIEDAVATGEARIQWSKRMALDGGMCERRKERYEPIPYALQHCLRRIIRATSTSQRREMTDIVGAGERSQDSPHLLQGQGLQEAHSAQGHPVQGRQGTLPSSAHHQSAHAHRFSRPPNTRRVSVVTTASSPVTVVRRSLCSTRRRRPRRRSCCG